MCTCYIAVKEKADVLVELEKLNIDKNDLTQEVSRLHILLEQERSKVATLTADVQQNKHKEKVFICSIFLILNIFL